MTHYAPEGWYPDPTGVPQQRFWDGEQWTQAIAAPTVITVAVPAPPAKDWAQRHPAWTTLIVIWIACMIWQWKWLVPVIRERLERDQRSDLAAAVVASWTRYAEGTDEAGEPIDVVDPLAAELVPRAQRSRTDPLAFVADPELFGTLAQDPLFTTPYLSALESLRSKGTRATLIDLLA